MLDNIILAYWFAVDIVMALVQVFYPTLILLLILWIVAKILEKRFS